MVSLGGNVVADNRTTMDLVKENIKSALEGGFEFENYTDEDLAGDLCAYAADLEDKTFEQVLQAVKTVRAEGIACQMMISGIIGRKTTSSF